MGSRIPKLGSSVEFDQASGPMGIPEDGGPVGITVSEVIDQARALLNGRGLTTQKRNPSFAP